MLTEHRLIRVVERRGKSPSPIPSPQRGEGKMGGTRGEGEPLTHTLRLRRTGLPTACPPKAEGRGIR